MKIRSSLPTANPRRETAFTLIEVIVAVSIILLSFVTIFGCMTMGLSVTQLSEQNLRATQIMLDKMEGIRLYAWSQVNDTNFLQTTFTNWFYETNNIGQISATGNGVQYTGAVAVATWPFSTAYTANMRQVTVTVGWSSGGINHTRSMNTYVNMTGLQNYVYNSDN